MNRERYSSIRTIRGDEGFGRKSLRNDRMKRELVCVELIGIKHDLYVV